EERNHAHDEERDPEEEEHNEVRDQQQPLDQPKPAAEASCELACELQRILRCDGFHYHTFPSSIRRRVGVSPSVVGESSRFPVLRSGTSFGAMTRLLTVASGWASARGRPGVRAGRVCSPPWLGRDKATLSPM